jgi:hypothetical protein
VSVIGITYVQLTHQMHPALATVAIQTAKVAELPIAILIRLIEAPQRHLRCCSGRRLNSSCAHPPDHTACPESAAHSAQNAVAARKKRYAHRGPIIEAIH